MSVGCIIRGSRDGTGKVVPYFGTIEKPECHMLYNVTMMATTWNTVATRDTRLLRMQLDIMNNLPKEYTS